jgi:hypothetical protein
MKSWLRMHRGNRLICEDVMQAVREGRSPLVLTERTNHLERLAELLGNEVRHLIILRGGMDRKELEAAMAHLASIPENEERVLLGDRALHRRRF